MLTYIDDKYLCKFLASGLIIGYYHKL